MFGFPVKAIIIHCKTKKKLIQQGILEKPDLVYLFDK